MAGSSIIQQKHELEAEETEIATGCFCRGPAGARPISCPVEVGSPSSS